MNRNDTLRQNNKITELRQYAESKSGKLLSNDYIDSKTSMLWECKESHQWLAAFASMKHRNSWCPKCSSKIALHFSSNSPKFGFSVRIPNPKHGATIIARSFFDLKGIDSKKYAGRYSDFETLKLSDIGQDKEGEAFVIKLKEADYSTQLEPSTDEVVIEDIGDEPINLDDIPF